MAYDTALLVGVMFTISTYLLLQKNFLRILFGFIIFSNAGNLFILAISGAPRGRRAPILEGDYPIQSYVDPFPQALVLTAIVIGLGLTVYLIMLLYRIILDSRTIDTEKLFQPEPDDE
jgi:multicomponent Na+:H+ antiporter subunit C